MRRRTLIFVAVSVLAASGLVGAVTASSAPRQDPRTEREQVRSERARVASQIDTSKASLAQVDAALQTLDQNLRTQQAALTRTESEVAQAEQDIARAEAAAARLAKQIVVLREEMRYRAVRAYVSPPSADVLTVLDTRDFTTASSRKFFIELRSQDDADVADKLAGARTDLQYQRRVAAAAKVRADAKRAEQAQRTDAVRTARVQQRRVSDQLQSTVNSQIARSVQLAKTDLALSRQIAQQQALLQARLLAEKAARERSAAQAAARAATRASANRPRPQLVSSPAHANQSPSGGETGPLSPVGSEGGGTGTGGIPLCTVGGITVNCQIQSQVAGLLNAARASGVALSGGGYRDPSEQIALRQQNCGSSYYAIYQMSSSSCRPPTAPPGSSQHEIGLAIDFSSCSRSSACYGWLRGNASRFGLYNLPSESWHWSTTGG